MTLPEKLIVPLVTPFTDDSTSLSEVRVARLVRFYAELGAAGFLVGSSAGEPWSLSLSERKQMLEWTMREARGMPVYVDATAMTTAAVIDLCQSAERHGARGAVYGAPWFGGHSEGEIDSLIRSVNRHGNLPTAFIGKANENHGQLESHIVIEPVVYKHATTEEVRLPEGTVSPLAVFGLERMAAFVESWAKLQLRIRATFSQSGTHRVARLVLKELGQECGPHRGPTQAPVGQAREMITALLTAG
ncbi:MAG: dihydrodipicolinate synthase family protein [Fimbriimonadaceae bacterium]|nr:dihydrodipicolinate synthase family protein [Fimbriimonadaceae bacterium]QYK55179.1 MAG: dihydrodipicolinate synthase family protein [Fimbriimonadaceae bacterium]